MTENKLTGTTSETLLAEMFGLIAERFKERLKMCMEDAAKYSFRSAKHQYWEGRAHGIQDAIWMLERWKEGANPEGEKK